MLAGAVSLSGCPALLGRPSVSTGRAAASSHGCTGSGAVSLSGCPVLGRLSLRVGLLLPDTDVLDLERRVLAVVAVRVPGRVPVVARVPEVTESRLRGISPRLRIRQVDPVIRKEAVGAANGDVEDKVEWLIKWSHAWIFRVSPRI